MSTVKKLSETVYEVSVTRNGEELKHLKEHVLVHFKDAKVDGFRKGHVPADVLEKKFKNFEKYKFATAISNCYKRF